MDLDFLRGEALPKTDGYVGSPMWENNGSSNAYYDLLTDTQYGVYTSDLQDIKSPTEEAV